MPQPVSNRDKKISERRDLLAATANYVCCDLSESVRENHQIEGEIYYYSIKDLEYVSTRYFEHVEQFKKDNDIESSRINKPKQAALIAFHILREQPIKAHDNVPDTVHLSFANSWFAYIVGLDLIGVDVADVEADIASEIQFLLRHKFDDVQTTILVMDLLRRAYGSRARMTLKALVPSVARRLWKPNLKTKTWGR